MNDYTLGFIVGFLLVLVICTVVAKIKGRKNKGSFDERQIMVRGQGYKYAFFTLLVCSLIIGFASDKDGVSLITKYMTLPTACFLSACISIAVYVEYCVWNEGYLSVEEQKNFKPVIILFSTIGVLNLAIGILEWKEMFVDGVMQIRSSNLICGILMLFVSINVLLKQMINKKHEDDDDLDDEEEA